MTDDDTPEQILLVDDIPQNLVALKGILANPRYTLLQATSGEEALRIALREELTLVLLDVVMPGMDGFEVARHLKQLERTRDIPIVFLTAIATDIKHVYRAYDIGVVDYLTKPLDPEVVKKKVAVFVELVRQRREVERQARQLREAERREFELRLAELRMASDRRYRKFVEGIDHAIAWSADGNSLRLTFVSHQAEQILGYPSHDFAAPDFWTKHLHPDDRDVVLQMFRQAVDAAEDRAMHHRFLAADGRTLWFQTGVSGEHGIAGEPPELHGASVDISAIKLAEESQRFIADASAMLAQSLDYRTNLGDLARRIVPDIADACLFDELDGIDAIAIAAAHDDPVKEEQLRSLGRRRLPTNPEAPIGIAKVAVTGASEIHHVHDVAWLWNALGAHASGPSPEAEAEAAVASTTVAPISMMLVPMSSRGRVIGVMTLVSTDPSRPFGDAERGLVEDIAYRAACAVDNARLYEQARRATEGRDALLGIVSHDLRGPLGAIGMGAAVVERLADDTPIGKRIRKSVHAILRSTQRMDRLISDLLDFAAVQAGRMSIDPQKLDAADVIRENVETFRPLAEEKSIHLEAEAAKDVFAHADRDRILQVLSNLVGNALKFTPSGGVIVVRARRGERDVLFTVEDTGPGIAEDELPHLFERFWQGKRGHEHSVGLGLSIARGIVEAHGGDIWAERGTHSGAIFHFTLPAEAEQAGLDTDARTDVIQQGDSPDSLRTH